MATKVTFVPVDLPRHAVAWAGLLTDAGPIRAMPRARIGVELEGETGVWFKGLALPCICVVTGIGFYDAAEEGACLHLAMLEIAEKDKDGKPKCKPHPASGTIGVPLLISRK
jgi:hypothetical protein